MKLSEIFAQEVIKKVLTFGGIAVLLIIVLVYLGKSCKTIDQNSELKGEITQLNQMLLTQRQVSQEEIGELEADITERNEEIINVTADIIAKEEEIQELHIVTQNLEKTLLFATQISKDDIIDNLKEQVTAWKDKFAIINTVVKDKDEIIFNLQGKYEAQVRISTYYEALWENTRVLMEKQKVRIKVLEGKQGNLQFVSTVKNIVIGGLVAYIGYGVIKK